MECRVFEITLISANNLEDVRQIFRMKVHARVSIGRGGPEREQQTPTDKHGGTNPTWNFAMKFTVGESVVRNNNTKLLVKLFCTRKMGDRYVGGVRIPMKQLFDFSKGTGGSSVMSIPVQKGGCRDSQGKLTFSFKFGEKVMGQPMSEEGGSGKGFSWRTTMKVLIKGVIYMIVMDDPFGSSIFDNDNGNDDNYEDEDDNGDDGEEEEEEEEEEE